jgi:predicted MFS family arabinose efflux permease
VLARFLIGQILGVCGGAWLGGFAADHASWRLPYALIAVLFAAVSIGVLRLDQRLPPRARIMRAGEGHVLSRLVGDFSGVLARPWARRILLIVFLEGVFLFGPIAFIATHAHKALGLSLSAAGGLLMLFGLGGFAFSVSAQQLVARLGEAGLARWGGVFMGAALLVVAFAPAWGWAVGGCFLLGLGYYMLHNTLQVNATQMAPDRRGAAVAAFASCFFLGQSVGVSLGGWSVGTIGTTRFLALGAIGVTGTAFVFLSFRRRHLESHSASAAASP